MPKDEANQPQRTVTNIFTAPFRPYDLEGPLQDDIAYLPLTYDKDGDGRGVYVIRMAPGAETIAHAHRFNEDYLIIEGDLIEPDGRVLGPGDFVHYEPATRHNSRTVTGCLLIGCDWGAGSDPAPLPSDPE